ncbi:MAG: NUDIX domain-containing protein [Pseudomonadota bacterium]
MADIPIRASIASLVAVRKIGQRHEMLLLKRTEPPADAWCQIAGKIEDGETAWQAVVRELHEEAGLRPGTLYSADVCEQFYEIQRDAIAVAPVFVAFVDPAKKVVLNQEHSAHRWVDFDDAIEMVTFGGQRKIIRWIEEEFINRSPSKHLRIDFE